MSFLKSLFGWGGMQRGGSAATAKHFEYKGFIIEARPYKDGGQYQTAGVVTKNVEGVRKEHKFVRADRFTTLDEAADFAITKGRQIIDEQGDRLFL